MAFVHSLVRTETSGKIGWCAPAEMGEDAPHYVSFVVPVNDKREFFSSYTCETIVAEKHDRRSQPHDLILQGEESFLLRLSEFDVWFNVRPVPRAERRLPYVGKLQHPDFALLLTEIEPESPELLDKLFDEASTFLIGCEPFSHYDGIEGLVKSYFAER